MCYNLLLHLNREDEFSLNAALGYARNYLAALPDGNFKIVILVNGPAVKYFQQNSACAAEVAGLLKSVHVTLLLCRHAWEANQLKEEDKISGGRFVPAGIVELVRLQSEGFAYVKP